MLEMCCDGVTPAHAPSGSASKRPQTRMPTSSLRSSLITSARGVHSLTEDVGGLGRSRSCSIMTVTRNILIGDCATRLQPTLAQLGDIGRPCGSVYRDRPQRRHSSRFSRIAAVQWSSGSVLTTSVSYHRRPCQQSVRAPVFAGKRTSIRFYKCTCYVGLYGQDVAATD